MNETSSDLTNLTISTNTFSLQSHIINCTILVIYIVFGLIGNILNIILFTSRTLFRTSSSAYLLSASIGDLIVTIFVIPFRLAADGFDQDLTSYSLFSCRLVSYIYYICLALPSFFTVLACADRWAASCTQANRRKFASTYTTKRLIPFSIIFCCLLYSYILIIFTVDPQPPPPYCSVDDNYAIFALSFHLIIYSFIPPCLMILFSIGIIYNVVQKRDRIRPANNAVNILPNGEDIRRGTRGISQMQLMLICQSITQCISTLPFGIINLIAMFVDNNEYFLAIYSFCRLFLFINYILSFYVYTLSSKLYRDELKKLFLRFFNHS